MNYFVFDDIDTRDYSGIYVSFSNVDKTPKRVYDVVGIPARNGAFYIDKQRFEDVEHSYYVIAMTKAIGSQFINDLASKVGYHRLEDSFNTDEFYSAVFTSGADIKITSQRDKNTFKVTFTRKPQRWLVSGETAITVEDGDEIENPTPFEAEPLLAVDGYGTIGFNGYEIDVANATMGTVLINGGGVLAINSPRTTTIQADLLNTSDTFSIQPTFRINYVKNGSTINGASVSSTTGCSATVYHNVTWTIVTLMDSATFTKGTSSTASCSVSYTITTGSANSCTASCSVAYDGDDTLTFSVTATSVTGTTVKKTVEWHDVYGNSSISILGNPTYIDCDIGECYMIKNSEIISLNQYIDLGSDLPKLSSGTNTFNYDNTVTQLEVTPRWWKV